jgi:hypothetical protein
VTEDSAFDPRVVCFTFDVEWSSQPVIDDVRRLLDERGIRGTFFVTHAGVDVGDHERGLHPNFRRNGDIYRMLPNAGELSDAEVQRHVMEVALSFAPEAKGVRAHSLLFDSMLLPLYRRLGIEYDATFRLELVPGLRPFWKQDGIVEIPTYYADYFDLLAHATGFRAAGLTLGQPGMKVLDFHPNLVYINAPDVASYDATRPFYHDAERLAAARYPGLGTRTLFVELLDAVAAGGFPTATLGAVNRAWRAANPNW